MENLKQRGIETESVLDQPREGLDANVWKNDGNGEYSLTEEAKSKIYLVIGWAVDFLKINRYGVNIIGSITSNSYSDDSDIDLHFNTDEIPEERCDEVNRGFRAAFEEYKERNPNDVTIGNHPIEVYVQKNRFQDEMSVGCYDVINEKWIVGPDLKPMDFDPYDEYYEEDMKYVNEVIDDIRNVILECFESAIVITNSKDEGFRKFEMNHLNDRISKAAQIFTSAREFRSVVSAPKSSEDAASNRMSRKWKIADSAFKLLDKFGYLAILRDMTQCWEKRQEGGISDEEIVEKVISSIRENIGNNGNLTESELGAFGEIDEGLGKHLGTLALAASMMGLPGLATAKNVGGSSVGIPKAVQDIAKDNAFINKRFGGLSYPKLVNLLATVVYNEAMIDYRKYRTSKNAEIDVTNKGAVEKDEGVRGLVAIANVVQNRAGGKPENFVREISKPGAFYSTREVRGGYSDSSYREFFPGKDKYGRRQWYDETCWGLCVRIAVAAIQGTLCNVVGNNNMIANKGKDNASDWESWGKYASQKIGSHTFGYQRSEDGYRNGIASKERDSGVSSPKTYVVKSGDTLSGIAKTNNTTVDDILKKNPSIRDASSINIGQKISI